MITKMGEVGPIRAGIALSTRYRASNTYGMVIIGWMSLIAFLVLTPDSPLDSEHTNSRPVAYAPFGHTHRTGSLRIWMRMMALARKT